MRVFAMVESDVFVGVKQCVSNKERFYWVLLWGSSASSKRVAARVSRLLDMMSVMV